MQVIEDTTGDILYTICVPGECFPPRVYRDGPHTAKAGKEQPTGAELKALVPRPKADRATRVLLIRDVDPQVLYYVCKNPRITLDEVLEITRLGTLSAQVADLIASSAQWAQSEQVRLNLVQNPKTPTPIALKLIAGLNIRHLQAMAKSWNIRPQIKQAALKTVIERGGR